MALKYCIFDIGNVCYPYNPQPLNDFFRHRTPDKKAFDQKGGIYAFDFDPFMKGQITLTQCCKDLCAYSSIAYTPALENEVNQASHDTIGPFYEETKLLMAELKKKGIQICLLSNISPNLWDITENITDDNKRFLSYDLGLLKPDPEIYKVVLQKLNAQSSEVVFIDDQPRNVEAAQKLGITGIVFDKDTIIGKVREVFMQI